MSVYIKGIEMPIHCMDCPFMVSRDDDDCILQSAEANSSFEDWEQMKANCPLVFVPPHGRLIDADTLLQDHKSAFVDRDGYPEFSYTAIIEAPTIIPAEKED